MLRLMPDRLSQNFYGQDETRESKKIEARTYISGSKIIMYANDIQSVYTTTPPHYKNHRYANTGVDVVKQTSS